MSDEDKNRYIHYLYNDLYKDRSLMFKNEEGLINLEKFFEG